MKIRILSVLLLFILFVHHSSEQGIESSHLGIPSTDDRGGSVYENTASVSENNGLSNALRNRTNSLLQRLEGPRDRVLEFIKPAVKSEFSRNVTNVLNSIWSRVQNSNSSIIRNPLFRNTIVIPINTTLSRLKQITAADNDNTNADLEIINLNKPEDEAHLREYLRPSSSSEEAVSNAPVIFLFREEEKDRLPSASEDSESSEVPPADTPHDEDDQDSTEKPIDKPNIVVNPPSHNPTKSAQKSKRSPVSSEVSDDEPPIDQSNNPPSHNPTKSVKKA